MQAGNGNEALEVLGKEWVDLVITDYNMPDMNGMELIQEMKKDDILKHYPRSGGDHRREQAEGGGVHRERGRRLCEKTVYAGSNPFGNQLKYWESRNMKEALKAAVTTSISEVLETMFFMTIDPTEVSDWDSVVEDAAGERLFITKITYQGPLSGFFLLMVPESILSAMTETFMGMDASEVSEPHLDRHHFRSRQHDRRKYLQQARRPGRVQSGDSGIGGRQRPCRPVCRPPEWKKSDTGLKPRVEIIGLLLYYSV